MTNRKDFISKNPEIQELIRNLAIKKTAFCSDNYVALTQEGNAHRLDRQIEEKSPSR